MISQISYESDSLKCSEASPQPDTVGTPARLNLFLVGDNRTNLNWGRAASIALRQILSGTFKITGCVTGDWFNLSTAEAGYVGTLMPAKYYRFFRSLLLRRRRWPADWYMKLERLIGAQDFLVEDPAQSIDNLVAHKRRYGALERIYSQAAQADMMVLDGDGDIIFSTPPRRQTLFLLAMIELGVRLKKPVFLVNSMISDCPLTGRNSKTLATARHLFARCRAVSLRDPESLEYVRKEMPETNASLIPDSLFAWQPIFNCDSSHPPSDGNFILPYPEQDQFWDKLNFSVPYICIGGNALAGTQPDRAVESYARLVTALGELGLRVYLTENDTPDSFLQRVSAETGAGIIPVNAPILMCGAVLAHARLFISGRYHPSIFASLGGTPCIFLESHAHKMASLSRVLHYEDQTHFNAFPTASDIVEIVSAAKKYLDQGESLRTRIRDVAKLHCEAACGLPAFLLQRMYS